MEIIEHAPRPDEFLENTKLELYQDQVFCFTPQGDLFELPNGATPVDFAYAVHSMVGDTCVGSKVNGRIVPLNTRLQNGDQVEIKRSKEGTPNPNWARIRRFIRGQQREQYAGLGKTMLQKVYRTEGHEFQEKDLQPFCRQFRCDAIEDIYTGIGSGHVNARDVFKAVFPEFKASADVPATDKPKSVNNTTHKNKGKNKGKSSPMPIKGLIPGMALHFARCCHPLPGDRIVGIVTTGRGVTIHTTECDTLEAFADTPERWLDVAWDEANETPETRIGRLNVTVANEPGSLGTVSTVIGQNGGNITNLKIINRDLDFWDMLLDVYVRDLEHLSNVIAALRATPEIASVSRTKGR